MGKELLLAWRTTKDIIDGGITYLPNLILGILIYWLFAYLSGVLSKIILHIGERAKLDITLAHALGTLSSAGLNVLGILVAAVFIVPGFKPTHIVTGLGLTSIAAGFAFKDILENFFSGLLLLWQKPFTLGDVIQTGTFEGTVEELRIKSTRLRTENGELVVIPNGMIFANPIVVRTAYKTKRTEITVAANPNRSIEANRKVIKQIIDSTEAIVSSPEPEILLTDISSGNQIFKIQYWTSSAPSTIAQAIDQVNSRMRDAMYQSAHNG
jgi:small conductance mechanosensitive channel